MGQKTAQIGSDQQREVIWAPLIPENEWAVYLEAIESIRRADVPFVLGGAFGLAGYTDRWRNTKDMDFFVRPGDRPRVIDALQAKGFQDYYDTLPYDRGWIFRFVKNGIIVDVIWGTPNRLTTVDDDWFHHSKTILLRGETLRVIPAEELLWIKLFVVQRDRCDWPDLINLLTAAAPTLNWPRLMSRVGQDKALLNALLLLFAWVSPHRIRDLPPALQENDLFASLARPGFEQEKRNIRMLDSRPWFAAEQPADRPMQL